MAGSDALDSPELASQIAAVAALNEPVRRALYAYVLSQPEPVGREEAARAVGIARELAAFHLDKLLEQGLVDVEYRRISGRSGPGAGRPAKLYRPSALQLEVTLPERRYDLAAQLMAQAIEEPGRDPVKSLGRMASRFGETLGVQARDHVGRRPSASRFLDVAGEELRKHGFEPTRTDDELRLGNCPFHALAQEHTELVCGMNLCLIEGLLDGLQAKGVEARLDPQAGLCCVVLACGRS